MFKDTEIFNIIEKEHNRQLHGMELIASENFVSDEVMRAMGSCLTNKYAEGYPGHRYYGGCQCVDESENIARDRVKKLFDAEYANVQPHSGAQANMAVFMACLKPGDKFMGLNLAMGGHLSHGSPVNFSGIMFNDCAPACEDPDSSLVAGKLGYSTIPVGVTPADHYGAWGYYIPSDSPNPEAAYVFLEWFNTPDVQKQIALDGGFPNLTSIYNDPDLEALPYWEASMEAYEISTTRPRIPQWNQMNEALMLQLSNCLAGQETPKDALDNAAKEFETILEGKLPVTYQ